MKTRSYFVYALCALLQSCNFANAQIVWLSTKNMDFTDCDCQERQVKPFDAVSNSCPFDVYYEQSDEQYVIVEGDKEYFGRLHTDVRRGVLEITIDPARYRNVRLRVKVGSPEINQISMAGSGSIHCTSDIVADSELNVRLAGSGDIVAQKIKCTTLQSTVSGSGDLKIADIDAGDASISIAGSGDWSAARIKTGNLTLSIAGSGDIEIVHAEVENTLTANVAGSGDIDVNGRARIVNAKVVGSGDISGRLSYDNISKSRSGSGDIDW